RDPSERQLEIRYPRSVRSGVIELLLADRQQSGFARLEQPDRRLNLVGVDQPAIAVSPQGSGEIAGEETVSGDSDRLDSALIAEDGPCLLAGPEPVDASAPEPDEDIVAEKIEGGGDSKPAPLARERPLEL